MRESRHNEKLINYVPLAAPDYREKGFQFDGCAIVVAAMKRWPGIVDSYAGSWEDYLRAQYCREARLQDALVVNLGTGEPLTEEEVRLADPYCLAVLYEDGSLSKVWEEPRVDRSQAMKEQVLKEPAPPYTHRPSAGHIQPNVENILDKHRFRGSPCKKCGEAIRYIKSKHCVPCSKAVEARYLEKKRLLAAEKVGTSAGG
jgi:hypothetical protein